MGVRVCKRCWLSVVGLMLAASQSRYESKEANETWGLPRAGERERESRGKRKENHNKSDAEKERRGGKQNDVVIIPHTPT